MQKLRHHVAVVDDEASVRKALRRLFASYDLECAAFASGQDFLDSLGQRVPECVVLDLHMPGLTGLDIQQELRRRSFDIPAIIITAHDEPETRTKCLAAGAAAYLRKPFEGRTLVDVVASALEGGRRTT